MSCANHLDPKNDLARLRIKDAYNFYLAGPIQGLKEKVCPPIPRSGFILRSSAVKAIPDLKITATSWYQDPTDQTWKNDHDPIVQLTKMDDFTIRCLFDCLPEQLYQLQIAQPPHQQRYALGEALVPDATGNVTPDVPLQIIYCQGATNVPTTWPVDTTVQLANLTSFYHQNTRGFDPTVIGDSLKNALLTSQAYPGVYTDQITNSVLLGLELNDPCCTSQSSFPIACSCC